MMPFFLFLAESGLYTCKISPTVKQLKHSDHGLEPPKSFNDGSHLADTAAVAAAALAAAAVAAAAVAAAAASAAAAAAAASGIVSKPSKLILMQGWQ